MQSKILFLVFGLMLALIILPGCKKPPVNTKTGEQNNLTKENQNVNQDQGGVPLPSENSTIRTFFELINEQRIDSAISMMTPSLTGDDTQKQAWGVQFNSFEKITVTKIEESMKETWTEKNHSYKVTLDVQMKPEATKAPIPYYGYENGANIRWIALEKMGDLWKIGGIATGP
jgi:hypothetical protein